MYPVMAHKLLFSFAAMASPILLSLALLYTTGAVFVVRCVRKAPRGQETDAGFEFEPEEADVAGEKAEPIGRKMRFWRSPRAKEGGGPSEEAALPGGELKRLSVKNPGTPRPK
jgi:hypothetical protein